ncbi:hypothetical protein, partial [Streptomyces mirabilis]|uniref:hypothetical protein n=1 Tax=Streptomyces mirabilis TaxID=68239 RepID=UPI0036CDA5DB
AGSWTMADRYLSFTGTAPGRVVARARGGAPPAAGPPPAAHPAEVGCAPGSDRVPPRGADSD